ncbi:hypothetical protein OIU76_026561 [Salix suchowensis]|nr:hypothetical protein OIU76_026561 [Salix suchowensis]
MKKISMRSPHVKEFKAALPCRLGIKPNQDWRMIRESPLVSKMNMSSAPEGRPERVNKDHVQLTPNRTITPGEMTTSVVEIIKAKIEIAFIKIGSLVHGNRAAVKLVILRQKRVEIP